MSSVSLKGSKLAVTAEPEGRYPSLFYDERGMPDNNTARTENNEVNCVAFPAWKANVVEKSAAMAGPQANQPWFGRDRSTPNMRNLVDAGKE